MRHKNFFASSCTDYIKHMLYCISTNTNIIFTPQVFQCLNHMGITVGSANARRCVQLLGSECDAEAMTWKKDIEADICFYTSIYI